MFAVYLFGLALLGGFLTIWFRHVKGIGRLEVMSGWLLGCALGLGGVWAFFGHAFFPEQVAESIGWVTSPFQWEIAMANLATGTLGLLSIFFKGRFRLAAAISANVYLLGCAAGHVHQMITTGNFSVNNAGPILWIGDFATPLLTLALVVAVEIKHRAD